MGAGTTGGLLPVSGCKTLKSHWRAVKLLPSPGRISPPPLRGAPGATGAINAIQPRLAAARSVLLSITRLQSDCTACAAILSRWSKAKAEDHFVSAGARARRKTEGCLMISNCPTTGYGAIRTSTAAPV